MRAAGDGMGCCSPCHVPCRAMCRVQPCRVQPCSVPCHFCHHQGSTAQWHASCKLRPAPLRPVHVMPRLVALRPSNLCRLMTCTPHPMPAAAAPRHDPSFAPMLHSPWHRPAGRRAGHLPGPVSECGGRALGAPAQGEGMPGWFPAAAWCIRCMRHLYVACSMACMHPGLPRAALPTGMTVCKTNKLHTAGMPTHCSRNCNRPTCRARGGRPTAAWLTGALCCAAAFASTSPARRCMRWGFPRRAR